MVKLVNQIDFTAKIRNKNILLFTPSDIQVLFGASAVATAGVLHRYKKRGFIVQVKRGLYAFPDALPPDVYIANALYSPSYISLEYALAWHGIIPETVYEITSVTPKATRRFETVGKIFSYRTIKQTAYTGYEIQHQQGCSFYMADAEKALVDAHYFRLKNKQPSISRFHKNKINLAKAIHYAKLFGNARLIGYIKATLQ